MGARGAHRVAIDAFGLDLRPPPPFQRVVEPDYHHAAGREALYHQLQQDTGRPDSTTAPDSAPDDNSQSATPGSAPSPVTLRSPCVCRAPAAPRPPTPGRAP